LVEPYEKIPLLGAANYRGDYRGGRRYRKRRDKTGHCGVIKDRVAISERPELVKTRDRLGDWEGDTIHGGRGNVVTLVDRKSGFLRADTVAQLTPRNVGKAIKCL
jgi:IS30 family transposase